VAGQNVVEVDSVDHAACTSLQYFRKGCEFMSLPNDLSPTSSGVRRQTAARGCESRRRWAIGAVWSYMGTHPRDRPSRGALRFRTRRGDPQPFSPQTQPVTRGPRARLKSPSRDEQAQNDRERSGRSADIWRAGPGSGLRAGCLGISGSSDVFGESSGRVSRPSSTSLPAPSSSLSRRPSDQWPSTQLRG
jgi:hypothetical protein